MAAAAVGRLKEGADAVLRAALEQRGRPPSAQMPQAEQERLAAAPARAAHLALDLVLRLRGARARAMCVCTPVPDAPAR